MRPKLTSTYLAIGFFVSCVLLVFAEPAVQGAEMKLEIQLLWGTDKETSPDPKHKPVEPDVKAKLSKLPLKWNNYFLVQSQKLSVLPGETKKAELSERCSVDVKNVRASEVEISLYGKGHELLKRAQSLPKGEILILGGNAPNETSWLVVIKRIE
jgi:hypothetical protein